MLIDWFTVAAQIVNFLILVYLLKRFLYKPIVRHMQERDETIKKRLQQAADKRAEAGELINEYQRKIEDFEKENEKKLEAAQNEANQRKKELLDEAQKEAQAKRQTWLEALQKDQENFTRELQERSGQAIIHLAGKTLSDLADESLNNRLAETLLDRLKNLDAKDRSRLARAGEKEGVSIRSTFELDPAQKRKITMAVHDLCGKEAEVTYQADEDFPLGVEIRADSVKLSWGTEPYLAELNNRIMSLVAEKSREQKSEPQEESKTGEKAAKAG